MRMLPSQSRDLTRVGPCDRDKEDLPTKRAVVRILVAPHDLSRPRRCVAYRDRMPPATHSKPARRILVYGVTGSGKSTAAQRIAARTGLPLPSPTSSPGRQVGCPSPRTSGAGGWRQLWHRTAGSSTLRTARGWTSSFPRGSRGRARLPAMVLAPACFQTFGDARHRQEANLQWQHRVVSGDVWSGLHHRLALPVLRPQARTHAYLSGSRRGTGGPAVHPVKRP